MEGYKERRAITEEGRRVWVGVWVGGQKGNEKQRGRKEEREGGWGEEPVRLGDGEEEGVRKGRRVEGVEQRMGGRRRAGRVEGRMEGVTEGVREGAREGVRE